jgi:hypothetical protein
MTVEQRAGLDRRGIASFLLLTFALTWGVEFTLMANGLRFGPDANPVAMAIFPVVNFLPAIAALIVRKWITREGFASAGLRLGPWKAWAAVWAGAPLLFAMTYGITHILGLGDLDLSIPQTMAALPPGSALPPGGMLLLLFLFSISLSPLILSLFAFGEEFGWTGYLLPKLLPFGRWRAAGIYGFIWGIWHAPAIFMGLNYPGYPWTGIFMMCLLCVAWGLSHAALRIRYQSVLLPTFMHGAINAQGQGGIFPLIVTGVNPLLGGITGLVGIGLFAAVGMQLLARTPDHR